MGINQTGYTRQPMGSPRRPQLCTARAETIRSQQRNEGKMGTRKMFFRHENQQEPSAQAQGPK